MTRLTLLLLPALAAAHFTLDAPVSVGPFDEDTEGTSPCGGVTLDFSKDNVTDFHVDGEAIELFLGHPEANWLFRATTDQTGSSNWTQIYPIFTQTGEGDYCQQAVAAPASLVGSTGVLGVVCDGPDGLLYQCAAVNFVSGSGNYSTTSCKNASGVTAAFSSDSSLTALVSADESQTNGTTTASSSSSASSSASVAPGLAPAVNGLFGSMVAVLAAGLLGSALML
ncbi:hypothetical protein M406DRAFT_248975 [Cryphonectria parasitica EP155]|uniref:Copper acquisition factor BIM1-like domain-containing protein n=1 Tax=Cryphonectria parasitica (strain ATCC 38755 / EP155) TaxID=660469 RepID=A0A9P4YAB7_CRYP1|nr:uncharacterized protein M406DRAFT_248975 [Cryphonectria parasitica EP155]KAF3769681.1 hypothetical protein M406DRAFT_248975 [Cryphonectria parasitica EP155]